MIVTCRRTIFRHFYIAGGAEQSAVRRHFSFKGLGLAGPAICDGGAMLPVLATNQRACSRDTQFSSSSSLGMATDTTSGDKWKARRKEKDAVTTSQDESKLYLEQAVLECSVQESRLREVIDLPPGIEYNEWLASHTIAFFDHTNLVYGTISEFCTMSGCPDMNGPNGRQYLWFDEKGKKCKVAAPQYIDCVMTFTQRTLYDESIFPTKFDRDFPSSFESIVKKIQRLLFHVLAHIYHIHFKEIVLLNMHAHLNALFAHFTLFNERFNIVDEKETEIIRDLAVALKLYGESAEGTSESEDQSKVAPTEEEAAPAVIENDNAADLIKDCNIVSNTNENSKRPPTYSQSSQSIASSISLALHSRSSSGSHSSSGSCAMDSALYSNGTPPALSSSPLKFQ